MDLRFILRGAENIQKHPLLAFPTLFCIGQCNVGSCARLGNGLAHWSCTPSSFKLWAKMSPHSHCHRRHVYMKPYPCHATAAFNKAPSQPATNTHHQCTPLPPDTTTHATHTRCCSSFPFHHLSRLASPRHALRHMVLHCTTPRHAMPQSYCTLDPLSMILLHFSAVA